MRVFITADTQREYIEIQHYDRIKMWCEEMNTTKEDLLIINGDAGFNNGNYLLDRLEKTKWEMLTISLLCIYGNHEERPEHLQYYDMIDWCGGKVWIEEEFPSILFARDGDIYNIAGQKVIVIGGAYSVDWYSRMIDGRPWWRDEQPSDEIKRIIERNLERAGWKVDVVLSHTCPKKYIPTEAFLEGIDQSKVDQSTEIWLDTIENRLSYGYWFCGHFHISKKTDRVRFVYNECVEFPERE